MTVKVVIKFEDGSTENYDQNIDLKQRPNLRKASEKTIENLFARLQKEGKYRGAPLVNPNKVIDPGPKATEIVSIDYGD